MQALQAALSEGIHEMPILQNETGGEMTPLPITYYECPTCRWIFNYRPADGKCPLCGTCAHIWTAVETPTNREHVKKLEALDNDPENAYTVNS